MPYFKWVGVDIVGATKKGKQAAHSSQDLSKKLLQQGIALLHSKSVYAPSFVWSINAKVKGDLFKQKAKLLHAGLLLPKVLEIAAQQSHNPLVHDMLFAISCDIQQGVPFAKALEKHNKLCDPIVMVMLTAGHESGNIINAVENVALYFHKQHAFNKSVRSALAMPFLTLLFFIGISLFIFVFIIPRFVDMFSSLQQELPALTRSMINISDFIRSSSMIYVLGVLAIICCVVHHYVRNAGKHVWDTVLVKIPFIGVVVWQYQMSQALQALSLLVGSGVTLVTGLKIVSDSVDHTMVKVQLADLHDDVAGGQLLSSAMVSSSIFLPEIVALITIGEETGALGQSLEAAAQIYNDTLDQSLRRFVFFLQPIIIILLGFLVTTLIFAVYLPIMQLSHAL
ncbi:MAG TPA: type II secretion system F family protein [Candidatus Babeliales bacterium]|jgi:type IV pilus assembly protein PilC|nr:type II secretion system F family protein [Candidatus Babeliales bacterium]